MRLFAARRRGALAAYAVLGLALWPVPLLGLVHVEASAVVAFVAFFVSGLSALGAFRGRAPAGFGRVLRRQEALLAVPLLLLTATLPWRPNCDYLRGLLLYLAMPPVTVAFAVALAYALAGLGVRYCRTVLVLTGLAVSLGGPLYDLGLHPQFYTYNHVFGGVLGPLYDRELALRPGFFAFRALTLLWALLFFLSGRWLRVRRQQGDAQERKQAEDGRSKIEDRGRPWKRTIHPLRSTIYGKHAHLLAAFVIALLIGAAYLNAARLGFNTPAWRIREALGGHLRTAHFDLYYDPDAVSEKELAYLAEDHEWRYRWLKKRLGAAPDERIASYLYPNEATKARLTGARRTSVSPVWLARPQTHLLLEAYEESFGHELVHAFSRTFGLPLLKASRSVGLVEGLAVAFEPPHGRPSPADQVSAGALLNVGDRRGLSLAEGVAARLSPLGFWAGRGAVSYTTMGAFVRFLSERYGAEKLRAVYAWGNFERVYGMPVRALAQEWEAALLAQPAVARAAGALAERRFSRPSLFEARCPHYVPSHRRAYRAGRRALAEGDSSAAMEAFREAVARQPAFEAARVSGARLLLARGAPAQALRFLALAPDSTHGSAFFLTRADAQALRSEYSWGALRSEYSWGALRSEARAARQSYERALERLPMYRHEARALVSLRHALADQPRVLRILAGPGAPLAKARRLGEVNETAPAAATMRALLLAEGERFGPAARLLERTPAGLPSAPVREAVQRQRLVWLAQLWHRAGRPARAEGYARRAARAYRALGDRDAAARWTTFAAKMRWAAS